MNILACYIFVKLEVILKVFCIPCVSCNSFYSLSVPDLSISISKSYLFISLLCLSVNQELLYVIFQVVGVAVSRALLPSGGYNPIIHDFHKHYITKESISFTGGAMALFFTKYSPLVGSFLLSQCRWL